MLGCIIPATPYSLTDGWRTLVGQAETQRAQAVHLAVKDSMPVDPGGDAGYSLSSFTVESFFGTIMVSWARTNWEPPASKRRDPVIKLRRELSGSSAGLEDLILTRPYDIAFSLHVSMQLKQLTHLLESTCLFRKSMNDDLHAIAHLPQRLHLASSNLILKSDILLRKPRNVPTGQTVLQ